MSVRISHPSIPNIYQSTIGDLQKLSESKNKLRSYFLAQKISRQQNLSNLEILYITRKKPEKIALLNTLSKYPNVVKLFKSDNVADLDNLSEDEKKYFTHYKY